MLMATVTPLSGYLPQREKRRKVNGYVAGPANDVRHDLTVEMYKKAWGDDIWLKTKEVERRLGVGNCTVTCTLQKWVDKYHICERRNVGKTFSKRYGYEWRFR
jgi:hypothetical protein